MAKLLKANAFSKDLCDWLNKRKSLGKRVGIDSWRSNYYLKGSRDCVDVVGLNNGSPVVLIEVELHREDPVSNVAKVWKWAAQHKKHQDFAFFQAFSRLYRKKKQQRKERAIFLGKRMQREMPMARYRSLNLKYNPRPRGHYGAGRRKRAALLLGRRVASHCSGVLGSK